MNGIYQATNDRALINEFKMDWLGGLEVTPIRQGQRYKKIIYRKKSGTTGVWEEAGIFKGKKRATYKLTNSGAMVWTSRSGSTITLVRTGQVVGDTKTYSLQGRFVFANNSSSVNSFRMIDGNTARVTTSRNGRPGRTLTYKRISDSEFKDTKGTGVYTVLPNGNLLWESRDSRKVRIDLIRK